MAHSWFNQYYLAHSSQFDIFVFDILGELSLKTTMSDPNFIQQAENFGIDAEVDATADRLANEAIEAVASHIPGEQAFNQALTTEADQVINNEINSEISKIEGRFSGQ